MNSIERKKRFTKESRRGNQNTSWLTERMKSRQRLIDPRATQLDTLCTMGFPLSQQDKQNILTARLHCLVNLGTNRFMSNSCSFWKTDLRQTYTQIANYSDCVRTSEMSKCGRRQIWVNFTQFWVNFTSIKFGIYHTDLFLSRIGFDKIRAILMICLSLFLSNRASKLSKWLTHNLWLWITFDCLWNERNKSLLKD